MADARTIPYQCASCNAVLISPVACDACHTLSERAPDLDHFGLLGIERWFQIDERALKQRYLALARSTHPDAFGGASDRLRELSVRLSAQVNEAYRVLRDPVLRAGYLLELAGGPSAAADRTVPPELLGSVMLIREELEEAKSAGDTVTIGRIRDDVRAERAATLDQIASLADAIDTVGPEQQQRIRALINSMKYYDNLLTETAVLSPES